MAYTDVQLKTLAMKEASMNNCNLFPNIRGKFFAGRQASKLPGYLFETIKSALYKMGIKERFAIILSPTRVETGLCAGASDMIGLTEVIITPDMVGKKIAVFTAIENKSLRDRFQKGQEEFLKMVAEAGGISAVQRETFEDAATEFQWVSDINWCNSQ